MNQQQFSAADHLAWSRFMLANLAVIGASRNADNSQLFITRAREQLSQAWKGLGAQGVEGAMLSMILTLEAMGCAIRSTQTSPENGEIIVEPFPGSGMLDGLTDRFDIQLDGDAWRTLIGADEDTANQIYDILGAIADGAEVEYVRERTDEGDMRLVLRAW